METPNPAKRMKIYSRIKGKWRELVAAVAVILFIITSVLTDNKSGVVVSFLILISILYLDRIKGIIIEMRIRRIFGIELAEEVFKEELRREALKRKPDLDEEDVDMIADLALNRIEGPYRKAKLFEDIVQLALNDLNLTFQRGVTYPSLASHPQIDFLVELGQERLVGIAVAYSDLMYLTDDHLFRAIKMSNALSEHFNLAGFLLITNAAVGERDKTTLNEQEPRIDVIESVISPDGVTSRLSSYFQQIAERIN